MRDNDGYDHYLWKSKGGVRKSTTSATTAFLLSQKGYKVLAIDMDSQANMVQMIANTDDLLQYEKRTIKEGMEEEDVRPYVLAATDNLHFIPADDYLVLVNEDRNIIRLKKALEPIQEYYDFIVIDTPPSLSKQTVNALMVSDYVVVMFQTEKLPYNALPRFMDSIEGAKQAGNQKLEIAGILPTLTDGRRNDGKELLQLVQEEYGELVFKTVLPRNAKISRLSVYGFFDNPELNDATKHHAKFLEELLNYVRVKEK
ncbi:chromosome partitioning protein [Salinibacillus kushneri]|uniref:Chromosome partitioning protein n=1 Tax=Salinibacillus kushneri TaxID=237682 RepID=A0A1I0EWC4_9BACI|nr:ParA family protein [Salinibacillus kushneri]SET49681.1 chromosome partitioning protein [Salinibacillus kushneri]